MQRHVYEPLELVPFYNIPQSDAFRDRAPDEFSDIFPWRTVADIESVLGDNRGGNPNLDSPLHPVYEGVLSYRKQFYDKEENHDSIRTEETSQGLFATMLQLELIRSTDKVFRNLIRATWEPDAAVEAIKKYADMKVKSTKILHDEALDFFIVELAELDQGEVIPEPTEIDGIPLISSREIAIALGEEPSTPEVELENSKSWTRNRIQDRRFRLQRLNFEWLSETAIINLLEIEVGSNPAN